MFAFLVLGMFLSGFCKFLIFFHHCEVSKTNQVYRSIGDLYGC